MYGFFGALSRIALLMVYNKHMSDKTMLETRYLHQPRGPGRGWVFRMPTPGLLVGEPNPKTGRKFGKTIHEGLGTRDLSEARHLRDIRLGELRLMVRNLVTGAEDVLFEREAWFKRKRELERIGDESQIEAIECHISSVAERQAQETGDEDAAFRWYQSVVGEVTPLRLAYEQYVAAKGQTLSQSTLNNLETAYRDFLAFAGQDVTMEQCDRRLIGDFLSDYLPGLTTPKAPNGPSPATIKKKASQLSQIWRWAMQRGFIPFEPMTPWDRQGPTATEVRKARNKIRPFRPTEAAALLQAAPNGEPVGDVIRIALLTGARLEEIASLDASQVDPDCGGYTIREGKTDNALRYVPLVGNAKDVVARRFTAANGAGPLFPELGVRVSTGKRGGALSQRFTRLRREVLGTETNGQLVQHSFRHTWRTAARRAGVDLRTAKELGGWSRGGSTDNPYDHGLEEEHYRMEQEKVADWLRGNGYLG
ncbi:MAG: tyrosine-type recombinase/integrase [Rhodospirillaceae bacterium]|nr:tyrosine-type recombinase/integrase [Rhodospirillaceae bacterium]